MTRSYDSYGVEYPIAETYQDELAVDRLSIWCTAGIGIRKIGFRIRLLHNSAKHVHCKAVNKPAQRYSSEV